MIIKKVDNNFYYRVTIKDTGEYYDCLSNMCAHKLGIMKSAEYIRRNYTVRVMKPIDEDKVYYEIKHDLCNIYKIELGQKRYNILKGGK